ncbi:hypothetical protein NKT34_18200 [Paenibacillus polysaccharolyticus]|uniref:hypothetical protein n=1 Tax=Paenibacillus polysaccharolyticus TaxID=582692 RepID=UPI00209EFC6A|nr:hypothetical protein [Paenibacillus polysaccharolyticus]MCP1135235.1 hypothetical protein [Paenibacillus polysaccharolyticus]
MKFVNTDPFERKRNAIKDHPEFNGIIMLFDYYINFIDRITDLIDNTIVMFLLKEKSYLYQHDHLYSAMYTLKSIKECVSIGNFSDANILIRKLNDDLFFYLFVLELDNNHQILFSNQVDKVENELFMKNINYFIKWDNDNLNDFYISRNALSYIKNNNTVSDLIIKYNLEEDWKKINKKLNNFVHNNGKNYCGQNFKILCSNELDHVFIELRNKVSFIFNIVIVLLVLIKPHYIMSIDHIMFLDSNITPPEDSQYWVASFVQEFFDEHLTQYNPELKIFLKENTYMEIL